MGHATFASYARLDGGREFKRFANQLREVLRRVTGHQDLNKVCFVDQRDIKLGDEWDVELANAVCGASTIVCLVSPTYLRSPWCGRELRVFLDRIEEWRKQPENRGKSARFVFPIQWEQIPGVIPHSLTRHQVTVEGLPPRYLEKGLRVLATIPRFRNDFLMVVEILASTLRDVLASGELLPALAVPADIHSYPSAFVEVLQAYDIRVAVRVPQGARWTCAELGPTSLGAFVDRVCYDLRIRHDPWSETEPVDQQVDDLIEKRQLLLGIARYDDPMVGDWVRSVWAAREHTALLLIDESSLDRAPAGPGIGTYLARHGRECEELALAGRCTVTSPTLLARNLELLLLRVRAQLMAKDGMARVGEPAIEDQAAQNGVPIQSKPILSGPTSGETPA
ncbi:MAG: toll/interleukin-1 receptor domain-containing protein [Pirellulales bacterium]